MNLNYFSHSHLRVTRQWHVTITNNNTQLTIFLLLKCEKTVKIN